MVARTNWMARGLRLIPLIPGLLIAQAFGGDCFCLVDADDAVWFDCRQQTRPLRTEPRVFCVDAATGKQVDLSGRKDLERVADGAPPCTPCRLSDARGLDQAIRGDDNEQETPSASASAGQGASSKAPP